MTEELFHMEECAKEKQKTVKQHFVPQYLLRNFLNDEMKLHVYDLHNKRFFSTSPEKVCYQDNLYETKLSDENQSPEDFLLCNDIENTFAKYEGNFATVTRKILKICDFPANQKALVLHNGEREWLLKSVANLIIRNPQNLELLGINEMEEDEMTDQIQRDLVAANAVGIYEDEAIYLHAKKRAALTYELDGSLPNKILESLKKLHFSFLYAGKGEFITSDVPVYLHETKDGKSPSVYFPLSPKVAVLFGTHEKIRECRNRIVFINDEEKVDSFNRGFINLDDGKRFIIGSSKKSLERCVRGFCLTN